MEESDRKEEKRSSAAPTDQEEKKSALEKENSEVDKKSLNQVSESKVVGQSPSQQRILTNASRISIEDRTEPAITQKVIDECTPMLFEIIYEIFTPEAPKATLKIGLIYLAKIMDFYPDFTEKYLEILLTCPENIRSSTLEMDPLPGTEEEIYVSGSNTEKYRTYGAP